MTAPEGRGSRGGARTVAQAAEGQTRPWGSRPSGYLPIYLGNPFAVPWARAGAALADAFVTEMDDGRAFLWLPVAFACGVALYFGADAEPSLIASGLLAGALILLAFALRRRPVAWFMACGLAVAACGFASATLHAARIAHPVLAGDIRSAEVSGFVVAREVRPKNGRIVLDITRFEARNVEAVPRRVRLTVPRSAVPAVGSHVTLRASLGPPPGPAYPGGYDFGQDLWFDGIGATGYSLGRPREMAAPFAAPLGVRFAAWLEGVRDRIDARILAVIPGDAGGIAAALVAGSRDAVSPAIEENMRVSGLAHVLSISGLHMALVAGVVFAIVRGLLALSPRLALLYPIKSWAAVPALLVALFYLALSGNDVPAQRSFVMTALVLVGVIAGRPALTLRSLAIAALIVLVFTPHALLEPGTQMSFAATLALVASYERLSGRIYRPDFGGWAGRLLGPASRFMLALLLSSLVAGLATALYAAFHFHRVSPLSLLANLAATPLVSFIIMPMGMAGVALMPFGWDGWCWRLMGWGIDGMTAISARVAALPGADGGMAAFGPSTLLLGTAALIVLCMARTRLVWLALPLAAGAAFLAPPLRPDVLIDARGETMAARTTGGALSIAGRRTNRFAVEQWLAADGARGTTEEPPGGFRCDPLGCAATLRDGTRVVLSLDIASLEDDCRLADLIVTRHPPPQGCKAEIIDARTLGRTGALALTLRGEPKEEGGAVASRFTISEARPSSIRRPWMPVLPQAVAPREGAASDRLPTESDDSP